MKGVSLTLEAVIAAVLLLLSIIFFFKPLQTPDTSEVNYKKTAYDSLKVLDEGGKLRKYALDNDASSIKNDLAAYISSPHYDVAIYNRTSNLTAIPTITSNDVISVSYFLAGDAGNYSAKEVKVFVWGFD